MGKTPNNPEENYADILKTAQEEAIKAAQEQAQAMLGNLAGFQMPGMEDLQAQIEAQMKACVPDLDQIQAAQAAMGAPGGMPAGMNISAEEIKQNMQLANAYAQAFGGYQQADTEDEEWEIERAGDGLLNDDQLRLLAFGAPLFIYNSEQVDSYASEYDTDTIREQMSDWWGIEDGATTWKTVRWLLGEGHHAEADEALRLLQAQDLEDIIVVQGLKGIGNAHPLESAEAGQAEGKMQDVCSILGLMIREGYCTADEVPSTVIAWDLVRVVNVARWTYQCGYITLDEMWQIMQTAEQTALSHFSSWEEYGRSFVLGRGVWHGDPDDCETAQELVTTLLHSAESPWKQIPWTA